MRGGGNQIGDIAGGLATAFDHHSLHVLCVSRKDPDRDAGNNLLVAFHGLHLAAGNQRIVVVADVADGIALVLLASMLPLPFLHVILGVRESCDNLVSLSHRVPSTMVEMQMGVDDDVDILGRNTCSSEIS